tara:strand:+ start:3794 stop:4921 length:1128 start_codon:yes stop_codon:yes gene_type:complete
MEWICDLTLSNEDAEYAASKFEEYYTQFEDMSEYFRKVKLERVDEMPRPLLGMNVSDDFFQDFDMHPNDMEFVVDWNPEPQVFHDYLSVVSSQVIEMSNPGRKVIFIVREKNTGKIVGFGRMGSPMMNIKPRNTYFGEVLSAEEMPVFNKHALMGMIIIPVQPFGYNYLGGKLLALMCISHELREVVNQKYDMDMCHFETTSLYGSTKSMSQYDGLKPFIKGQGLTESNFAPLMNDEYFRDLEKWFVDKNGGEAIVWPGASSRKMKAQAKMVGIIKKSLKDNTHFKQVMKDAESLQERKRYYISTMGFSNVKEVITGKETELKKAENYDRFSMDNLVAYWKKKASNRYENLKQDGRFRTTMEVWNENPDDIDIIR